MAHRFIDRSAGEFIPNRFFGNKTGAIRFQKEKEKDEHGEVVAVDIPIIETGDGLWETDWANWYDKGKEEMGDVCVRFDELGGGVEICFDNISIRQL